MRIRLLAVGTRLPRWAIEGCQTYAQRLPAGWLEIVEVAVAKRSKTGGAERGRDEEWARLEKLIPRGARLVALDARGEPWSTEALALELAAWMRDGRDTVLVIGGPDGLSPACLRRAERRWSLSSLTLPHSMARLIVAEQIYRSWSLLNHHPYHRA